MFIVIRREIFLNKSPLQKVRKRVLHVLDLVFLLCVNGSIYTIQCQNNVQYLLRQVLTGLIKIKMVDQGVGAWSSESEVCV